jgi:anti-sigma B factor antagonist
MELESRKEGENLVITPLVETINGPICTEFKSAVVDLINQGNHYILINLGKVKFVGSMGLGAFISILKAVELNKGKLVLCNISEPIFNMFKLTSLTLVFKICKNEKEGLDILSKLEQAK